MSFFRPKKRSNKKTFLLSILLSSFLFFISSGTFAQTYLMGTAPANNGATINTCSGNFFDSGNSGGNYGANQNITVTFTSAVAGSQIRMAFTSIVIGSGDTLRVYNGTTTSATLLYQFNPGTNLANVDLNSYVDGSLTFWFKSNGTGQAAGWSATINCLNGCSNSYNLCNGTSINWMETAAGSGLGTLRVCNLPNTAIHTYNLYRDTAGVMEYYSGSWDPGIINNTYNSNNIPSGRNAYGFSSWITTPWTEVCYEKMVLDFGCPSLNISNVKVSNCYLDSGISKYTVCAEVQWFGAKKGDSIVTNIGGKQSVIKTDRFISYLGPHDAENDGPPYTAALLETQLVSPQEICAELNANSSGNITANFPKANISISTPYSTGPSCDVLTCGAGYLGGTVFEDFNADGIKQSGEYAGVANVQVTVFGNDGNVYGPYTTDANGKYVANIPSNNYPLRVEFSNIPAEYGGGYSSPNGNDGRTTVQFVNAPDCSIDLGVTNSSTYSQATPLIVTPIFKNGDPLQNGTTKNSPGLLCFGQNANGDPGANSFSINYDKVGSLWAQAYNRKTKRLFSAAFLRRHSGLGPGGYDAIYVTDISNTGAPGIPTFFNLSTKGINVGTAPSNATRGLPANLDQPNMDTIGGVFNKVCNEGIGGIDISDDGNTLFVVNVKNNTLHKLDLTTFNSSNNVANITSAGTYNIPAIGCVGGSQKSFACKYYKGKIYVGSLCNAQTSNKSNLEASVFEFDINTSSFTEVLNFPLSYTKGPTSVNSPNHSLELSTGWDNWHYDYEAIFTQTEPVFMDIEFDIDGSLVLGFGDRKSFQMGYNNTIPDGSTGGKNAGGDILRAVKNSNGGYMLENNASVAGATGYGPGNSQGPGMGEFYNDDTWADSTLVHSETALGGIAIRPGSGQVISSHMDPITQPQTVTRWWESGGVRWYDNKTGTYIKGYQTYVSASTSPPSDGTFSKASGMGDVELLMDLPTYLEIGNYVWLDADKDGVQDPAEKRIANVNVSLYKGSTLIATTTSNANGEYFFSRAALHSGTWFGTGADTTLLTNTNYVVVFGTSGQFATGRLSAATNGYMHLSASNTGQGSFPDLNDNDAVLSSVAGGTYPNIAVSIGDVQYVNHNLDAAFTCDSIVNLNFTKNVATCNNSVPNNNGSLYLATAPTNAIRYRIRQGTNWSGASDTSFSTATLIGSTFPLLLVNNIANAGTNYIVRFYSGDLCYYDTVIIFDPVACYCAGSEAGPDKFLDCITTSTVIGTSGTGTSFAWTPATGLNASNVAQPIASPTTTTTYYLTVDGICRDTVTVFVNTSPPTADAGPNANLNCSTTSTTIGTASIAGNTYLWSPSTNLSNNTLAQPLANPTSTTVYTLSVTGSNGCTATSTVSVNVDRTAPTANAGPNANLNCTVTSTLIGTPAIAGNTYSWSPSAALSFPNAAQTNAYPIVNTTYTLTVTGSNGCSATSTVAINVDRVPPIAVAGNDIYLDCTTLNDTLGSNLIAGTTYNWSPTAGLNTPNSSNTIASPSFTTAYTLTATGTNGCTSTDVVMAFVDKSTPSVDLGNDINLNCTNTNATLTPSIISNNDCGVYVHSIANVQGNVSNPTNVQEAPDGVGSVLSRLTALDPYTRIVGDLGFDIAPGSTICFRVRKTDTNQAHAIVTLAYGNDGIDPSLNGYGSIATYTITTNTWQTICATVNFNCRYIKLTNDIGGDVEIDAMWNSCSTPCSITTYNWSSGASTATILVSPNVTTNYVLTVTNCRGCTASDTITVNVDNTAPIANAGPDKNLNCALNADSIGNAAQVGNTYLWQPSAGLSDTTQATTLASPTNSTSYTLTVQSANGCTATSTVNVNVNSNLGTAGNYVWFDVNGNGLSDDGTTNGINGATVELHKETSPGSNIFTLHQSTTTANDSNNNPGYYSFDICDLANYKIKFPLQQGGQKLTKLNASLNTDGNSDAGIVDGFSPTFSIDANGSGFAKTNLTIDAGYFSPAALGNFVWLDQNQDGIQNNNEVGVAGVGVDLFNNGPDSLPNTSDDNLIGSTRTDAYGYYFFDGLVAGTYNLTFTPGSNYIFTLNNNFGDNQTANNSDAWATQNNNYGRTGSIQLASAEVDSTIDAGLIPTNNSHTSVGDLVWLDLNSNGLLDNNEAGLAGVLVNLLNSNQQVISTAITDAKGNYLFNDVVPGNYSIQFIAKPGTYFTLPEIDGQCGNINDANNDNDADSKGFTKSFTVQADDQIINVDAGMRLQSNIEASIGDWVWFDKNQNGLQDLGETGLQGINVLLLDSNKNIIDSMLTDVLGQYAFNHLNAGKYYVRFNPLPNFSASIADTTIGEDGKGNNLLDSDADPLTGETGMIQLLPGSRNASVDAGFFSSMPLNNLGNFVWNDLNQNGLRDNNEPGVSGISISLRDASGNQVINPTNGAPYITSSDAFGYYSFVGLADGQYQIKVNALIPGTIFTQSNNAGDNHVDNNSDVNNLGFSPLFTLSGNETDTSVDIGIVDGRAVMTASIGNKIWYDLNNNGIQEVDECGVAGVHVTLKNIGNDGIANTIDDGTDLFTISNGFGEYLFSGLNAGNYTLTFSNLPSGFICSPTRASANSNLDSDGLPLSGNSSSTALITLAAGEDNLSYDLGIYKANCNVLGNYIWYDLNQDGMQGDPLVETPVAGIQVTLLDASGEVFDLNTGLPGVQAYVCSSDDNGRYLFVDLPDGNYSVRFSELPAGFGFANSNSGNDSLDSDVDLDGLSSTISLNGGTYNFTLDAGLISNRASLGDFVWHDINANGQQDVGEKGIPGVLVTVSDDNNNKISTCITNQDGRYLFNNLLPGNYVLEFANIPEGLTFTPWHLGDQNSDNDVNPITLKTNVVSLLAGEVNMSIDAGLSALHNSRVGDYVWYDVNANGLQDSGEPALAGTLITLRDGSNNVVGQTVSDGNGHYLFSNVAPGSGYTLSFMVNLPDYGLLSGNSTETPTFTIQEINNTSTSGSIVAPGNASNNNEGLSPAFDVLPNSNMYQFDAGIIAATPLALSELNLYATAYTTYNALEWKLNSKETVDHFVLERAISNNSFVAINQLAPNISNKYSYTDDDYNYRDVYYRVRVYYADGRIAYSNVKQITRELSQFVQVYPNPSKGSLYIKFSNNLDEDTPVLLYNELGQILINTAAHQNSSLLTLSIQHLATGSYTLKVGKLSYKINKM